MTPPGVVSDVERMARVTLSRIAEPGDVQIGRALREFGAVGAVERIREGQLDADRAAQWRKRLPDADAHTDLGAYERLGARPICPGEPEWPTQLDDLGDARPYVLWVRGSADLRYSCLRSVAVVGARAASAYGAHVTGEMTAALAERGWTVISGGAYGIDGTAHRGALAAGGTTVVALACGLDLTYPRGHQELFDQVARAGLLISEWPPGAIPLRPRFLVRNRVIAALARGTVVVEAALRSGALNTARYSSDLARAVMAVPGPVTSATSAGCHLLLRERGGLCVTGAAEVIERVGAIGADLAPPQRGPVLPRDALDPTTARVLEAVPARGGSGPATVAATAGTDIDTALSCLGELAAGGFVERCEKGWRLDRSAR